MYVDGGRKLHWLQDLQRRKKGLDEGVQGRLSQSVQVQRWAENQRPGKRSRQRTRRVNYMWRHTKVLKPFACLFENKRVEVNSLLVNDRDSRFPFVRERQKSGYQARTNRTELETAD